MSDSELTNNIIIVQFNLWQRTPLYTDRKISCYSRCPGNKKVIRKALNGAGIVTLTVFFNIYLQVKVKRKIIANFLFNRK